ncbi:hypothetical protein F3Y22_tig00110202pilonHSYRG00119 [Hibiscus syriacus]|uniref:Pentatricopeptide repeat-containing protein n=1 Tax=Hibiscus syriacus TaxID=106335 RepID=A0A6A3BDD8_HIBSY|nr:hypothetical protein F3Y22_tig00110202pilonHSYRG00119 [Hibiscus syriacus]
MNTLYSTLCCKNFSAVGVAAAVQLETPTPENLSWRTMCNTWVSYFHAVLQLCARNKAAIHGKACHVRAIHFGLQEDTTTSNILINLYCKSGLLSSARKVFDGMQHEARTKQPSMGKHAMSFVQRPQSVRWNASTKLGFLEYIDWLPLIQTCLWELHWLMLCKVGLVKDASWVSRAAGEVLLHGVNDQFYSLPLCGCSGLAALMKENSVEDAYTVFTGIEEKCVSWNTMISGFSKHARALEAMISFENAADESLP